MSLLTFVTIEKPRSIFLYQAVFRRFTYPYGSRLLCQNVSGGKEDATLKRTSCLDISQVLGTAAFRLKLAGLSAQVARFLT